MFQRETSFQSRKANPTFRTDHSRAGCLNHPQVVRPRLLGFLIVSLSLLISTSVTLANDFDGRRLIIPILGTTVNEQWEQVGIVAEVEVEFLARQDHSGLNIQFLREPGRFSPLAQRSVTEAIRLVAEAANLNTDSWTVRFTLPYSGVTMYGESLSAMAALSVVSLAKHEPLLSGTVITGTVTSDGHIGTVGGVPLKIYAAHEGHFRRVLIPEEQDVADGDWPTPFLMHVSPVGSLTKAYYALTDRNLYQSPVEGQLSVGLIQ